MKHPILGTAATPYYFIIWALIGVAHFCLLYFHFELHWLPAALDSVVFNDIFAGMGLGFWYLVRYQVPKDITDRSPLLTLLGTGVIALFLWIWICTGLLQLILTDADYLQFLDESLLLRTISGTFYYVLIILMYYLIMYNQNLQEQKNRQLQLSNEVKDAELRMLKSQINPHFIFNSLNSISSLTISDPARAQQMIINLSSFLRYSIGKDNRETNELATELENIELYLAIEKVRFGNRLQFHNKVPESCYKCTIPNLLLQPLFENAIKHGVQESIETITINLNGHISNNSLHIKITNNFDRDSVSSSGTGIGLKNITQRLALLYNREDLLKYQVNGNEFEVLLEIPQ
jgi:sensor histidine kinase YesM